jgi:ureidoacrylate peracid hydrolase
MRKETAMSKDWLFPDSIAKITARDGAPHSIISFNPAKTVLLVVDMQNYYIMEGQGAYSPAARTLVPNINRLAETMRRIGGSVIWARNYVDDHAFRSWSVHYDRMTEAKRVTRERSLSKGGLGFHIWHELDTREDDLYIDKARYSAFIDTACGLEDLLRTRDVDTLVVCGVSTNVCVESTARDAMMLNYRVLIAADACAAGSETLHAATLNSFYLNFGDVQATDDIIARLENSLPKARAAG